MSGWRRLLGGCFVYRGLRGSYWLLRRIWPYRPRPECIDIALNGGGAFVGCVDARAGPYTIDFYKRSLRIDRAASTAHRFLGLPGNRWLGPQPKAP